MFLIKDSIKKAVFLPPLFLVRYNHLCSLTTAGFADAVSHINLFNDEVFERLRDCLTGIKGKFILSLNDTPRVRELFKDFIIEQVDVTYSISKTGCCNRSEVIITN